MFSNLARNLLLMLMPEQRGSVWLTKYALCAFLFVLLLPVIYRKNIKELRGITYLLFTGVITMLLVFFIRAMSGSTSETTHDDVHYDKGSVFDSMTIILTSYGFILNFYPVFSSLEVQSNKNGVAATVLAMSFCFVVYFIFSHLGITCYPDVHPNIFENLKAEGTTLITITVFAIFLCIFLCNIPFVFLPGKEALLALVEEAQTRSMSIELARRMDIKRRGSFLEVSVEATRKKAISERVPESTYTLLTIGLFITQILLALLIDDITLIFGFFAAFSETVFNFILPGFFYIQSCRLTKRKPEPLWFIVSIAYLIIGLTIMIAANIANVIKILN